MKAIVATGLMCLLVMLPASGQEPGCATFASGSNGWTNTNSASVFTQGFADVTDDSGGSTIDAPAQWWGNWLQFSGGCGELCFRVNVRDDGTFGTNPAVRPYLVIADNAGHSASFQTTPFAEGSGWQSFCAPVTEMRGGSLPVSTQGAWTYRNAGVVVTPTPAQWKSLLENVASFKFAIDITSGTERIGFDDICFRPRSCVKADFVPRSTCVGSPVTTFDTSAGATSWQWNFGANATPQTATGQAPTVTYNTPGTHPITLCVNGGTAAPLCVTKNVTIQAPPAQPVISGPKNTCTKTGTYCVANPQPGVTYSWSVQGGTLSSNSGTCVTVTWSGATGTVTVIGVSPTKACSSGNSMDVLKCDPPDPCCPDPFFQVPSATLVQLSATAYQLRPVISSSQPVTRITMDVLSVTQIFTTSCGTTKALPAAILNARPASPPLPLTPAVTVFGGAEATWSGAATPFAGNTFPIDMQLPAANFKCVDTIRICVKYTLTTKDCRNCQRVICYEFKRGIIKGDPLEPHLPPHLPPINL